MNVLSSRTTHFSNTAVTSYERTYMKLFEQSEEEADRLVRLNEILKVAEESLMAEDIRTFSVQERLMLIDILVKSKTASSTGLIAYSEVFKEIKNVVGLMESMHKATSTNLDISDAVLLEDSDDTSELPGL